jgi:hypothetical protein
VNEDGSYTVKPGYSTFFLVYKRDTLYYSGRLSHFILQIVIKPAQPCNEPIDKPSSWSDSALIAKRNKLAFSLHTKYRRLHTACRNASPFIAIHFLLKIL